jgi:kumamolisin
VHDTTNKPSVISISWGSAEPNWTSQAVSAMNSALQDAISLNVAVFVAAGDNLSTDSLTDGAVHVDFPASSPYAIGCGGTRLDAAGTQINDEVVWNDGTSGTGGGISALFPVPSFQQTLTLPPNASTGATGRGVPDVAGNASPETGYSIVVNGQTETVGGTSAVAPLWAGLTALINQQNAAPAGFFLPTLYANAATAMRQITSGTNVPSDGSPGYTAGPGWNACTGLGVPNGAAVASVLAPAAS